MKNLFALFIVVFAWGFGAVETFVITWNPEVCQDSCIAGLDVQFQRLVAVENVQMDGRAGRATLKWKKGKPFDFLAVNRAVQMIGVAINSTRIEVSGTVREERSSVFLTSSPDGTRFELLNAVRPSLNEFRIEYSPYNRDLPMQLLKRLKETADKKKVITVSGPLLLPERGSPYRLIVERINW
ncbi:MAG: hypothetical protein KDK65_05230 [Chlamydiia bacterium]|nr:hypothetical protein [Chlamydiia bacterium]